MAFQQTGSVIHLRRPGRPSEENERAPLVEKELRKQQTNHRFGVASSPSVAQNTGLPQTAVIRILRNRLNMKPYKLLQSQALSTIDHERRVDFANFVLSDQVDLNKIL